MHDPEGSALTLFGTAINEGGALRHLHLFGFYVLSKTFIAIKNKIGLII